MFLDIYLRGVSSNVYFNLYSIFNIQSIQIVHNVCQWCTQPWAAAFAQTHQKGKELCSAGSKLVPHLLIDVNQLGWTSGKAGEIGAKGMTGCPGQWCGEEVTAGQRFVGRLHTSLGSGPWINYQSKGCFASNAQLKFFQDGT